MEILIKSFNRPYYLDRCLQSIYLNCNTNDIPIKILDDGTPQKYLDKLKQKYPKIVILKSQWYNQKAFFCQDGKQPDIMKIPIEFWIESIKNSTSFFLLLEDDMWINQKIDLSEIFSEAKKENVSFLKLFWIGNPDLLQIKKPRRKKNFILYEPTLYTKHPILFYIIFYKFDFFKIRKVFRFLKIYSLKKFLAYYSIYSVAGMIFNQQYFLSLWKNHVDQIDESLQLYNALKQYNSNKIEYAHTNNEIVTQGILSSATNQFKSFENNKVDMFFFNKMLNEAWYNNEFDSQKNYPKDLSIDDIETIINYKTGNTFDSQIWKNWVDNFKKQYTDFGCIVEN